MDGKHFIFFLLDLLQRNWKHEHQCSHSSLLTSSFIQHSGGHILHKIRKVKLIHWSCLNTDSTVQKVYITIENVIFHFSYLISHEGNVVLYELDTSKVTLFISKVDAKLLGFEEYPIIIFSWTSMWAFFRIILNLPYIPTISSFSFKCSIVLCR